MVNANRPADLTSEPPPVKGYYLRAATMLSADCCPATAKGTRPVARVATWECSIRELKPGETRREWFGSIDVNLISSTFHPDSALHAFGLAAFRPSRVVGGDSPPARFALASDGTLQVEQRIMLDDGRTLTVSGERISSLTISCRY